MHPPTDPISSTFSCLSEAVGIELINPHIPRGRIHSVLFDFDGTLSLIREGWRDIMVPMMVEILAELNTGETRAALTAVVTGFVDRLTGQQTIYQMLRLCEQIRKRGGSPADPLDYKHCYHDRLLQHIEGRIAGLESGAIAPEDLMLPGTLDLLENLQHRGLVLYLASGTDVDYVRSEADLLGVAPYFQGRIFGALDQYRNFSKAMLIQDIIRTHNLKGGDLLGFGDGYVEIENVKEAGGIAVGVASDEARREGVNAWKRERLLRAGADLIVPEYREQDRLVAYLCNDHA